MSTTGRKPLTHTRQVVHIAPSLDLSNAAKTYPLPSAQPFETSCIAGSIHAAIAAESGKTDNAS